MRIRERDGETSSDYIKMLLIENFEYPLAEEGIQVARIQIVRKVQAVSMLPASHTTAAYRKH